MTFTSTVELRTTAGAKLFELPAMVELSWPLGSP